LDNPFSEGRVDKLFESYRNKDGLLLTKRRERTDLEFKESFNYAGLAEYAKEMVAFANTEGGYIVFGIGDSPHELSGLDEKSLELFEGYEPKRVSRHFRKHFSHVINFDQTLYNYNGRHFGLFFTHECLNKPVICKTSYEKGNEVLYSEGDIIYRYDSESENIKYQELREIINKNVQKEKRSWQELFEQLSSISAASTASILDVEKKEIDGKRVIMDEKLQDQINFIKKGEFSEEEGAPTLRLDGEIEGIEGGIPTAEPDLDNVFDMFVEGNREYPEIYLKHLRYEYTYVPIWFFATQLGQQNSIDILQSCSGGKPGIKDKLLERLKEPFCKQDNIRTGSVNYKGEVFDFMDDFDLDELENNQNLKSLLKKTSEEFFDTHDNIKPFLYSQAIKRNVLRWLLLNQFSTIRNKKEWTKEGIKFLTQVMTNIESEELHTNEENILDTLAFLKRKYRNFEGKQDLIRKSFANIDLIKYAPG